MIKLISGDKEVDINTMSNMPLIEDLFHKWGIKLEPHIVVSDIDKITSELSAWGIPWKRTKWIY